MPRPADFLALILPVLAAVVFVLGALASGIASIQESLAGLLPGLAGAMLGVFLAGPAWGLTTLKRQPYLQNLGQTSVRILCRTSSRAALRIEYGEGFLYDHAVTEPTSTTRHEVILTGLAPGRLYYYRVLDGGTALASGSAFRFRTDAGRSKTTFTFFTTADVGDNTGGHQQDTQAMIRKVTPRPEFGLLAGDLVYPDGNSSDYDTNLMHPWQELLCNTPVWPALGNHDWMSNPETNFRAEWSLPNNEHYYAFDYGNARFIALDTQSGALYDRANQLAWLRQELATPHGQTWTFVFFHIPFLTCTYKGNDPNLSADLMPLFDKYAVDMVFTGHAHTYERLFPIRGGVPVDRWQDPYYADPHGTFYVVSGCGGHYETGSPTTTCGPTAFFLDGHILFTQVIVNDHSLVLRTFDSLSGTIVDLMTLTKTHPYSTDAALLVTPRVRLLQNAPNPFNPVTVIPFEVHEAGPVRLDVYRADGRWIANLVHRVYERGTYRVVWDARDHAQQPVASGVYLAELRAPAASATIKMTVAR